MAASRRRTERALQTTCSVSPLSGLALMAGGRPTTSSFVLASWLASVLVTLPLPLTTPFPARVGVVAALLARRSDDGDDSMAVSQCVACCPRHLHLLLSLVHGLVQARVRVAAGCDDAPSDVARPHRQRPETGTACQRQAHVSHRQRVGHEGTGWLGCAILKSHRPSYLPAATTLDPSS